MPVVATVLFFHAHPDDEAIATGGTMIKLAEEGHRVLLLTATRGEMGEVPDGFLGEGEVLGERRSRELEAACRHLGVARGEFLGYHDSDMAGRPGNDNPDCFWQADVDEAAQRIAGLFHDETVDVVVVYDSNGAYGHPDHIQVHRVGIRAAELLGAKHVYESTIDRDRLRSLLAAAPREPDAPDVPTDVEGLGVPTDQITTRIDVGRYIDRKRAAMKEHASQINDESFFMKMGDELFMDVWGTEVYIRRGAPAGTAEGDLLVGP